MPFPLVSKGGGGGGGNNPCCIWVNLFFPQGVGFSLRIGGGVDRGWRDRLSQYGLATCVAV